MPLRVHLGGHLSWYDRARRAWLTLDPQEVLSARPEAAAAPLTPSNLANHLGLPRGEIALVVVNGRAVSLDAAPLGDDDRVEFYPPIGGG